MSETEQCRRMSNESVDLYAAIEQSLHLRMLRDAQLNISSLGTTIHDEQQEQQQLRPRRASHRRPQNDRQRSPTNNHHNVMEIYPQQKGRQYHNQNQLPINNKKRSQSQPRSLQMSAAMGDSTRITRPVISKSISMKEHSTIREPHIQNECVGDVAKNTKTKTLRKQHQSQVTSSSLIRSQRGNHSSRSAPDLTRSAPDLTIASNLARRHHSSLKMELRNDILKERPALTTRNWREQIAERLGGRYSPIRNKLKNATNKETPKPEAVPKVIVCSNDFASHIQDELTLASQDDTQTLRLKFLWSKN